MIKLSYHPTAAAAIALEGDSRNRRFVLVSHGGVQMETISGAEFGALYAAEVIAEREDLQRRAARQTEAAERFRGKGWFEAAAEAEENARILTNQIR